MIDVALVSKIDSLRAELPLQEFCDRVRDIEVSFERASEAFEDDAFPLLEAHIACQFGTLTEATHLQLAPKFNPGYDFSVRRNGQLKHFDVTEAKDPARDRLAEYRDLEANNVSMTETSSDEINRQIESAIPRISLRLKRKARAKGARSIVLYVNTGWLPDNEIFDENVPLWHQKYACRFDEAFLLVRSGLIQFAPMISEFGHWRR